MALLIPSYRGAAKDTKHMIRSLVLSSAFVAGLMSTAAWADSIVAKVNGKDIKYSEVMAQKDELGKEAQAVPAETLFPLLQNKMVNEIIMEMAAAKSGIEKDPEVLEALEKLKQRLYMQAFLAKQIKGLVTDAAVKARYDDLVAKFPNEKEVKLRHIVVDDEKTANAVIKALANSTDFAKLAKEKSTDKTTAKQGGELGFVAKSILPKEMQAAVASLKVGEYSKTPVKTEFGWHVFKIDEERDAKPPKFEEAKDELKNMMAEEELVKFMEKLRGEAKVELFDKDGKPMPAKTVAATPGAAAPTTGTGTPVTTGTGETATTGAATTTTPATGTTPTTATGTTAPAATGATPTTAPAATTPATGTPTAAK